MSHQFYETDPSRGFLRGYSFELMRGVGPVTTALLGGQGGWLPWGAAHHAAFGAVFDHTAGLLAICEDLPELHNRVTLDPELVDGHGIPAPQDRVPPRREQQPDARARRGAREAGAGGRRREAGDLGGAACAWRAGT